MNQLLQPENIPEFLKSPKTQRRLLKLKCAVLSLFCCAGCLMLLLIVGFLFFTNPTGYSADEIGPAGPFYQKLWPVAFIVVLVLLNFYSLRHALRQLKQLSQNSNLEQKISQ